MKYSFPEEYKQVVELTHIVTCYFDSKLDDYVYETRAVLVNEKTKQKSLLARINELCEQKGLKLCAYGSNEQYLELAIEDKERKELKSFSIMGTQKALGWLENYSELCVYCDKCDSTMYCEKEDDGISKERCLKGCKHFTKEK